jgi:ribosomal protein S18 acetylase RimI-like enzyme
VIYRPYNPEDFDQLYALEELCFEPLFRFSRRTMREFMGHPRAATWVAEENGRMAGFAIVQWSERRGQSRAYIQTIEVAPEDRRRGVGEELLNWIECTASGAGATSIWLHVEVENAGAIRLYEAQGYHCQGRKENFYPQGQAALIYMKKLDQPDSVGATDSMHSNPANAGQSSSTS